MRVTKPVHKKRNKKSRFRKVSDWLHLWLGLGSGLIVVIIGLTGCIYAFQVEISEMIHYDEIFVKVPAHANPLPLSTLKLQAEKALGKGKEIGFMTSYKDPGRTWEFGVFKGGDPKAFFYFDAVDYYDVVFINPYTGKVTLVIDYKNEFFNIIKYIHWSLLINHPVGQQVIGWSTFIFVILLVTGMIMWWPGNLKKSNFDKSFKVKWGASFKRLNYDLHNVPGFYAMLIALILSLTGMVWAFEWFKNTVYVVATLSTVVPENKTMKSDRTETAIKNPLDAAFYAVEKQFPYARRIGISPAYGKDGVIYAYAYGSEETYYDADEVQLDQYTGKMLNHKNYRKQNAGEQLSNMNYDIHVGAILGLPGKILAFCASLIAASLPITGFIIWQGRRKKKTG